eukprot:TRINITY_DN2070_c0_g4_i1.p1 TRINITY_DN2070_c0_g4~~TRINITY_DN2070_c0_g4_i1.p1  ORF type:complete len:688 (-),score=48.56 TRINITY_DN2070_c0_g4_i1:264-2327(-)
MCDASDLATAPGWSGGPAAAVVVYVGVVSKRICCYFSSLSPSKVVSAVKSCSPSTVVSAVKKCWMFFQKTDNPAVRKMIDQRRVRRAQLFLGYSLHCAALWAILIVNNKRGSFKYPWLPYHWSDTALNDQFKLMDSELIPMSFVFLVCLCAQVRPIRSIFILDALTITSALVVACQYYLMSQSITGLNVELYLYNGSWILMLHIWINLAIGRAIVAVPCTIVVAIVDVQCLGHLTTLYRHGNFVFTHYPFKQFFVCLMVCLFQICLDVLRVREIQAAVAANSSNLHEHLATRLTDSMCDAVIHLDSSLTLARPAPKLGFMLFRDKLGVLPTSFLKFVKADEHQRFENYMNYAASADIVETLCPQNFTLLDSLGCSCKVQLFVSAYCDDEKAVHYILGISELVDFHCKQRRINANLALDDARHINASDIPEESIIESSDGEIGINPSEVSESSGEQNLVMMEVSICQRSGIILHDNVNFHSWVKAECRGKHFPSLFHDPSEVWVWLQTSTSHLSLEQSESRHDAPRRKFTIVRRGKVIDVELEVIGARSQDDGVSALDLRIRVFKCLGRSTRRGRASKNIHEPRAILVRAVGHCIDSALDAALDLAEKKYKPMLRERWGEWVTWFNQCSNWIEEAPFQSSHGDFKLDLFERGPEDVVVSLQVFRAGPDRTVSALQSETSVIGKSTFPL